MTDLLKKPEAEEASSLFETIELPPAVRAKLDALGINGSSVLQVQSDLDQAGRWGRRFLVATPTRVVVVSSPDGADGNGKPASLLPLNGLPLNGLPMGDSSTRLDGEDVRVEFDQPLDNIVSTEAKTLVGSSALEARVRLDRSHSYDVDGKLNGNDANGNGTNRNGNSANVTVAPDAQEHVVELLRSSNARSRELSNAARRLTDLREGKASQENPEEDDKWKRKTCPKCGRPLPEDSSVCPFCVNKLQALQRLLSYLGPHKWRAVANILLSFSAIALSFAPLLIFTYLIGHVLDPKPARPHTNHDYYMLATLIGVGLGCSALSSLIGALRGWNQAFLGAHVIHDIRTQLYDQLQRLSLAYYDKREIGAVMSRVQNDTGMLQNFLLDGLEGMITSALTIVIVLVLMFTKSWVLALAVLIPVPFVVFGTTTYWRGLMKLWRRVWHQTSSMNARLADSLNGVRVVRAFAQERYEVDRFTAKSGELRDATKSVEQKAALFYPTLGFIMGIGGPLVWYLGGARVLDGTLQISALFLFTGLLGRLYEPIQQLTRVVNFTTRAMTAAERVFEILDTAPEVNEKPDAVPMPRVEGGVQFKDVTFGYDRYRPVLHNINLEVQPGEMIGLVGHSGAGKSTLINLLMRFYDVDEGAIMVDGVDIRDIRRDDIRRQIGVVLQEPYLFHGTVFANIAYGKPDATAEDVMTAAKAAFAHDFIVNFPDGYDTLVGERGTRLSGGERQRISIARAILHDPRILILDEATASVDTQTEMEIQKALRNLVQGRTTFAIAHRLSTLRHANRLIVLEGGKIVEQGTHDELMARHGVFYKLINAQRAINDAHVVGG
jgi:ATP-binding cassette subfamily B protein